MPNIEVYFNENLKKYNTFHIGGKAKYLLVVYNENLLHKVCYECKTHNIHYKVIGLGSNLLFDDEGYNGAIIVNRSEKIYKQKNTITVSSGTTIASLINYATTHSLSGLEPFAGIPSTLGGAITNNMGAHGYEISDFIISIKCCEKNNPNTILTLKNKDCDFKYRNSIFKSNKYIILSATLRLNRGNINDIRNKTQEYLKLKLNTQPLNKQSAGSVFLRSNLIPALVIDNLGLKGYSIGDAQISKKHAGFIINKGRAKAKDVLKLIEYINMSVFDRYCTTFIPEIEYVTRN